MPTCSTNFCTLPLQTVSPKKSFITNNGWDAASATGSMSITVDSPTAWSTTYDWDRASSVNVTAYPAVICGWHNGLGGDGWNYPYTDTGLPIQLSSDIPMVANVTAVQTLDAACGVSRTCIYDVAY